MNAVVKLSRRKPLIISLVVVLGVAIFSSSYFIRKNQIANDEFQQQSLGVSTEADPLENEPIMIDLVLEGTNLNAIVGSELDGVCLLESSRQTLSSELIEGVCEFSEVRTTVREIVVTFRSNDQTEIATGKINL